MKRFMCLQSAACSGRLDLETELEIFASFFNKELGFFLVVAATVAMMI
jgi:hypothetical protein